MANGLSLFGIGLPAVLLLGLSTLGCGDDDDDPTNTGGMGGGAGTAGASGSGGVGNAAGTGGTQNCDADTGPIDPTALIDDLEDGDSTLELPSPGAWWISTDMTGGTVQPMGDALATPERILGGRCESTYAMRVTGEGFTEWGISMSAAFRYDAVAADVASIDASSYRGVRFWARRGETHRSDVRVQFQDAQTMPQGAICEDVPGSAEACYNGFGVTLAPLDTTWRLYQLDFSRMTQRDFGHIAEAFDTTQIYQIEFNMTQDAVFDFWVDDLWFYE